jgi:hypothetical protein
VSYLALMHKSATDLDLLFSAIFLVDVPDLDSCRFMFASIRNNFDVNAKFLRFQVLTLAELILKMKINQEIR